MNRLVDVLENRPPFYISAGVLKHRDEIERAAAIPTVAALVLGAYTEREWAGNSQGGRKQVFYFDAVNQAAYNSIGLQNPGRKNASSYLSDSIARVQAEGQLAVVQVTTLKDEDPLAVLPGLAEWALEMGADRVEVNGSCPNLDPKHSLLCQDVEQSYAVFEAIRSRIGHTPQAGYKVSPLDPQTIFRYTTEGKLPVNFIDTINTKGNQPSPINPATGQPYIEVNDGYAGMSGPIVHNLARENLAAWTAGYNAGESPAFEVWSVGGVTGGKDIAERISFYGATLVGGAQEMVRTGRPESVLSRWAIEYAEIISQ